MTWALITGASSGLGTEFARLAAADGWNLLLAARSLDRLQALAAELAARHGVEAVALRADLAAPGAAAALWAEASAGREIGLLVNDAGVGVRADFGADPAREAEVIAVNVRAYAELMALAATEMRARGAGRILNVASLAGFLPGPGMAVYHASKAFALSLSEAVATELAPHGVTVTALCPGTTDTPWTKTAHKSPTLLRRLLPVGRPDAVAQAGWRAMQAGRRVKVTGAHNVAFSQAPRLLPRRLLAAATAKLLTPKG